MVGRGYVTEPHPLPTTTKNKRERNKRKEICLEFGVKDQPWNKEETTPTLTTVVPHSRCYFVS